MLSTTGESKVTITVTKVSVPQTAATSPSPRVHITPPARAPREFQVDRTALGQRWARQAHPTRVTLIVTVNSLSLSLSLQEDCIARYKLLVELVQKKKQAKS